MTQSKTGGGSGGDRASLGKGGNGGGDVKVDLPDFSKVDYTLDTSKLNYEQGPKGEKLKIDKRAGPDGPEVVTGYNDSKGDFIDHGLAAGKHPDGSRRFELEVYAGKEHGKSTVWYPNGQISKQGLMKEGKSHGKWIEFYENGKNKSESYALNGKQHGVDIEWFETGQKLSESTWVDGKTHGSHVAYYESGKKAVELPFYNGDQQGVQIKWDAQGGEVYRLRWQRGSPSFSPKSASRSAFRAVGDDLHKDVFNFRLDKWLETFGPPDSGYSPNNIPQPGGPGRSSTWVYKCRDGGVEMQIRLTSRWSSNNNKKVVITLISIEKAKNL